MQMKIGILISGRGSNMVAIAEATASGRIPDSEISVVISNRSDATGISRARELGLRVVVVEREGRTREEHDKEIAEVIETHGVDLVCLAGYMRILSPDFVQRFRNKIVNIHPSLLPSFPGTDAVRQAIEYGVKVTGCTVHFVDEELDHGPIIEQVPVPVLVDDDYESLSGRILEAEHGAYISALAKITSNGLKLTGRVVKEL
jgi:phosphoribosylglycinamide formyltransferase 1